VKPVKLLYKFISVSSGIVHNISHHHARGKGFPDLQIRFATGCLKLTSPEDVRIELMPKIGFMSDNLGMQAKASLGTKRRIDLTISLVLLVLNIPVIAVIAIIIKLGGGPIFFSHNRVGRDGKMFGCLKFRTMHLNAERILAEHLVTDEAAAAEWNATRKLRNDPRITFFGHILRSTSLDELPQLINVIRADMSLVGPRPVTREELQRFYHTSAASAYLSVRPGITGLWQVSGRSTTGYDRRVALDEMYADCHSVWGDFKILFRTIAVVLSRDGAV
jgi:exopolysaccharide production protein ExoY